MAAAAGGLGVLTAHLDLPVVAETTVQANLLHAERKEDMRIGATSENEKKSNSRDWCSEKVGGY
jgi:hypothetical protein